MAGQYWLMKSEPSKYSFAQLVKDGRTTWDGVRNFEARNNLRGMRKGDLAFFYHSNEGKEIVGLVRVDREAYEDPTAPGEDWSVVDIAPVMSLKAPVSLDVIKSDPTLADLALLKRSRLSVVPVSKPHFDHLLGLAKTRLPAGAAGTGTRTRRPANAPAGRPAAAPAARPVVAPAARPAVAPARRASAAK